MVFNDVCRNVYQFFIVCKPSYLSELHKLERGKLAFTFEACTCLIKENY
jgi:hypothetical protein